MRASCSNPAKPPTSMAMGAWTAKTLAFCSLPGAKQVAVTWMETAQWTALTLGSYSLLGDHD